MDNGQETLGKYCTLTWVPKELDTTSAQRQWKSKNMHEIICVVPVYKGGRSDKMKTFACVFIEVVI